ncbi:chitobiase/beta-hexosaminidase C-terminal domain-containing protein [Maribacter chungangensis]|uniref:Chitobiase/beta-hexosaminidase C-terminal domain-containing protein n=1 Tax=Maribacter chungangensis TaxID=1069117 RepID=A0ABW3B4F7_9FLAO
MRSTLYAIVCFCVVLSSCKEKEVVVYADSNIFELAPPKISVDSLLFKSNARLNAIFNMEGSEIRYTTDGSEVTRKSPLYQQPIAVTEPSEFKFRSFHPHYLPSKSVGTRLLKVQKDVSTAKVTLTPQPDVNYKGSGAKGLVDLRKGTTQFRAGDYWMGFQGKQIRVLLDFEKETFLTKLIVSSLKDHGSWIFLPRSIRVFANKKEEIGMVSVSVPTTTEPKGISLLDVPVTAGNYKSIEVHFDLMETIPEWHQGKGTAPFFFIDEILVE